MWRPGPHRHPPETAPPFLRPAAAPLPSGAQVTPGQVGPAPPALPGRPLRRSEVSAAPGPGPRGWRVTARPSPPAKSLPSAGVARQESSRSGRCLRAGGSGGAGRAALRCPPRGSRPPSLPPPLGPQKLQVGRSPAPGAAAGGEQFPVPSPGGGSCLGVALHVGIVVV